MFAVWPPASTGITDDGTFFKQLGNRGIRHCPISININCPIGSFFEIFPINLWLFPVGNDLFPVGNSFFCLLHDAPQYSFTRNVLPDFKYTQCGALVK